MPNSFLINYVRNQFGFIPSEITQGMRRAAEAAYNAANA